MRATRANSVFALILVTPKIEIDLIFPKSVNVELHIVNNRDTNGLLFTADSLLNFGQP